MSAHLSSTAIFDSDVLIGASTITPDVKLHVIESGTKVTPYTDTVLALQNSSITTTNCVLNMISGNAGNCDLWFGDTDNATVGHIQWGNSNNVLTVGRSGGVATFNSDGVTVTGTTASQVVQTDGNNRLTSSNALPLITTKAGTGTATPRVGGMLYEDYTTAENSGTGEDDLKTYTLPAGTMANAGDTLMIHATGALDSTVETKTVKFYFAGGSVALVSSSDISKYWNFRAVIQRVTATSAQLTIVYHQGSANTLGTASSLIHHSTATISTLASDQVIKFTGEATSSSLLSQFEMQIIYYPAYDA
jgi:hypothetical protein